MKKAITGIVAVLVAAFVIVLAVNAQNGPRGTKKAGTEMSKDCSKCPAASSCCKMKYGTASQTKSCDQSKCKEKGCDPATCKGGKCDKGECKSTSSAAKGCPGKCATPPAAGTGTAN